MILLLTAADQIIKIIVKNYYGVTIPIIEKILYFMPKLNNKYSWINSLFDLGLGKAVHIIFAGVLLFIAYFGFEYYYMKKGQSNIMCLMETFLVSGALCSLIDKIFWNGSLDYIFLKGFFVFDLKDCYITTFEIAAFILIAKNWKNISKISEKELLISYFGFIKGRLLLNKKADVS
jgi:signal peptidase II